MTDWAAKVLEGVPRHADSQGCEPEYILEADVLAAIARMGAGGDELQFPDGWRERAHSFKGILKLQAAWADGFNAARDLAAAHIAALTERSDWLSKLAHTAAEKGMKAEAERDALRAKVARLEGAEARSKAIREFCDRAGIKPSVEVSGLPDDVKRWRMEAAVAARRAALTDGAADE